MAKSKNQETVADKTGRVAYLVDMAKAEALERSTLEDKLKRNHAVLTFAKRFSGKVIRGCKFPGPRIDEFIILISGYVDIYR